MQSCNPSTTLLDLINLLKVIWSVDCMVVLGSLELYDDGLVYGEHQVLRRTVYPV